MIGRRSFLSFVAASGVLYRFAPALAAAAPAAPAPARARRKALVVLFQRGAVDGLSMVPPVSDARYYDARPTIAIARPGSGDDPALPLDGTFGLHPALAPLTKAWDARKLAIVHAVGSPDPTRSHFDAQDFVESGTPGGKSTEDGWLNRALAASPAPASAPLRAVAFQPNLPRILAGAAPTVAVASLADFRVGGAKDAVARDFEHMYAGALDEALRGTASEAFDAMRTVRAIPANAPAKNGATYPTSPLGKRLREIAQLLDADVGLQVAVTDCGGWDTHAGQGNGKGQLAGRLADLGQSLAAFALDIEDRLADVCVVTVTEFGRTVRENGTRGTDHGHGSVMMVLGGGVHGKKVYARWKGLAPEALWQGRDLPVTTDHRDVFAEVARTHLGTKDLKPVFPGYTPARVGLFG